MSLNGSKQAANQDPEGEEDGFVDRNADEADFERKKKALIEDFKSETYHQPSSMSRKPPDEPKLEGEPESFRGSIGNQ